MNLRRQSACELAAALKSDGRNCWVFPAFPHLALVADTAIGSDLQVGAQDVSPEGDGAFTGDVSAGMLVDLGCRLVLIGHSERRHGYSEDDQLLRRKLAAAVNSGLKPLFCVGETLADRKAGKASEVVLRQLEAAKGFGLAAVAYEPVWAIGTGENATPRQAAEMHSLIRAALPGPGAVPVLYGGSVNPDNAAELLALPEVDGVLVGGASLKLDSLRVIDDIAQEN
jgi:triosephosphate isomerase